jgi:hypothetical protein
MNERSPSGKPAGLLLNGGDAFRRKLRLIRILDIFLKSEANIQSGKFGLLLPHKPLLALRDFCGRRSPGSTLIRKNGA